MKKRDLINLIITATISIFCSSPLFADNWQEFAVYPSSEDQENPDIYGDTIVWQQLVSGDWDIYGADISNPQSPSTFSIAAFTNDQTTPAIYSSTVVWQDFVENDWGIYAVDLTSPEDVFTISDLEKISSQKPQQWFSPAKNSESGTKICRLRNS